MITVFKLLPIPSDEEVKGEREVLNALILGYNKLGASPNASRINLNGLLVVL